MMQKIPLLGMALLLALAAAAGPQGPPPPTPPDAAGQGNTAQRQRPPAISISTQTVIVPVTVKDSQGQLVGNLQKDDFRIFSDNVEQKVRQFSAEPVPLSAVVLIDNDLGQQAAAQVQKSLTAISAGFGPSDEAALLTYDQFPETVSDFSVNNDLLFTTLKRLEIGSHNGQVIADPTTAGPTSVGPATPTGGPMPQHGSQRYKITTALDDALFAAGDMLKARGRDRRKIIFLVSDGSNSKLNTHTYDQTLHSLLAADVSVYAILVSRSVPLGRALLQHGVSELDKYAVSTGGDTFTATKQPELERLYSDVTEQARNQYTLTFVPDDVDRTQDFHPIEVRVKRPGLTVDTRAGYYMSSIGVGH
jgi:Ca-activated chloride channel family protein